jgi:hypothetical protein
MVAAIVAAPYIPTARWRLVSLLAAAGVLLALGQWSRIWPDRTGSHWKLAAERIRQLSISQDTPVICPSPFIEAQPPVWQPALPLPHFLYSHLYMYPIPGSPKLFPFQTSAWAENYAEWLIRESLSPARRFLIYGGDRETIYWRNWLASKPALAGWKVQRVGPFGNVEVILFEHGGDK